MRHAILVLTALAATGTAGHAATFDIANATGLFTPTFRGDANTTWVGWDTFDDAGAGDMIINDSTPDLGTHPGSFVTTNGEDHLSGSLNYYSSSGTVAEDISFTTDGTVGTGFTTVIVQGVTLFGGFGAEVQFGELDGVSPTQVVQATNANGSGQLWAKYELPGNDVNELLSISSDPFSFVSFGEFTVDTSWSPNSYAADNAIATPEPTALALLALVSAGLATVCGSRAS